MKPGLFFQCPFFLTLVLLFACEHNFSGIKTEPEPPQPEILLSQAGQSGLQEIYLKLEVNNLQLSQVFELCRDDSTVWRDSLFAAGTTLVDTGLSPATLYRYRAYVLRDSVKTDSSNLLTAGTMDTTSHEFQWEMNTFGDGNGTHLRDVFIIDENDIWAVGDIHVRDSTGNYIYPPYNSIHWDGTRWETKKIPAVTAWGTQSNSPILTVYGFGSNDIWTFSLAGSYSHWNGNYWESEYVAARQGSINKMWGRSSSDIYFVGTNGNITHFDGNDWQEMESGTDVNLLDVWGSPDGETVWACGWEDFKPTVLLRLQNGIWEKVYEDETHKFTVRHDSLSGKLVSGWSFDDRYIHLLSSRGMYQAPVSTKGEGRRFSFAASAFPGFPFRMRGNGENDFVITGEYFMIAHYNGSSWRHYESLMGQGRFWSVHQKGNLVCAVGRNFDFFSKAIILTGRR